jgi:hypothetical protein
MLNIQFVIDDKDLNRTLHGLETAHTPQALAKFMTRTVGPYLQERARLRFRNEGDDVSGKWAPLSQTTNAFRESSGFPPDHPINQRTHRLEQYITGTRAGVAPTTDGAQLTFPAVPPDGVMAKKVATAQYGKAKPRTPARPVLGINETDIAFVRLSLEEYIGQAMRGIL